MLLEGCRLSVSITKLFQENETKGNYKILGKLQECKQKECFQGRLLWSTEEVHYIFPERKSECYMDCCAEGHVLSLVSGADSHQRFCCAVPSAHNEIL